MSAESARMIHRLRQMRRKCSVMFTQRESTVDTIARHSTQRSTIRERDSARAFAFPFSPPHPLVVVLALAAANVAVVALVIRRPGWRARAPATLVAVPVLVWCGVKLVERPQRGVLLLAALIPFDGLHEIVAYPSGWKEAVVLATLAATFLAPPAARAASGRRLPGWAIAIGALFALASCPRSASAPIRGSSGCASCSSTSSSRWRSGAARSTPASAITS